MRIAILFASLVLPFTTARAQQLSAKDVSKYVGNSKWAWTIFLTGPRALLNEIDYVEYQTSDSSKSVQRVEITSNPRYPFGFEGTSSGVLEINIKVVFKNGESQDIRHLLHLARAPSPCLPIMFVLGERPVRLADPRFKGDVYLYVDEIRDQWRKRPPTLTVLYGFTSIWQYDQNGQGPHVLANNFASRTKGVPASTKWSLTVREEGDAIWFRYGTATYLLTVKKVSVDVPLQSFGLNVDRANQITIQICEASPNLIGNLNSTIGLPLDSGAPQCR